MENTLNLVIITLLVIAIIYGMILNYRLSNFKETKKEILKASASFKQISQNTERALTQLQKSTNMMTEQLREEINKASLVRDDLALVLDKTAQNKIFEEKNHTPFFHSASEYHSFAQNKTSFEHSSVDLYQSEAEKELVNALKRLREGA